MSIKNSLEPNSRHRNPKDMKDEYERTLGLIEGQEQLQSSANSVDIRDMAKDPALPIYGKLDDPTSGTKGESEFPKYPETEKFTKEHSFDSQTTKQGTDSGRTPKFAKEDIRDGHKGA